MRRIKYLFLSAVLALMPLYVLCANAGLGSLYQADFDDGIVGSLSSYEITYTVDTAEQTWADGDTLTITLPDNFPEWSALTYTVEHDDDTSDDGVNEDEILEGVGNGEYSVSSRTLTVKWDLTTWGAVVDDNETIRVRITAGAKPMYVDATSEIVFAGTTAAADTDPSGTHNLNITIGSLYTTNVEPAELGESLRNKVTVSFTTGADLGTSAQILVTFPSGFDLTSVQNGGNPVDCSGITCSNWTIGVSGQTVTLTEGGVESLDSGTYSFAIDDVTNPSSLGTTGTYTLLTKHSSGNDAETDTSVTADTIIAVSSHGSSVLVDPTNLSVTDYEEGGVILTWEDPNGDDSTHINIYRGVDPYPVSGDEIGSVTVGTEYYVDDEVEEGDVVTYLIRSTDGRNFTSGVEVTHTVSDSADSEEQESSEEEYEDDDEDVSDGDVVSEDDADSGDADEENSEEDESEDSLEEEDVFTDTHGHWARNEIQYMFANGVVEGYGDGKFEPSGKLYRAEAAAMLYRLFSDDEPGVLDEDPFDDVDMNEWYAGYIASLADLGVINGNPDGTCSPGEQVNRAEFLQMAMNLYEYFNGEVDDSGLTDAYEDLDTSEWYGQVVSNATSLGFVEGEHLSGGNYFYAWREVTRAEAVTILYRMFAE